ncbi:hypothetical protein ABPG74_017587 [Tetrahymena malaccensis]
MSKKFSILAQLLVLIGLYFLVNEVKNNFQYNISYILTRVFMLNVLVSTFLYFQKKERDSFFDSDDILFYNIQSYNYFHLFWLINILLNIAMIVNNFSRKLFILTDSAEDWIYVFCMFFSTYIHYSLHYQVVNFTHMFSQTSTACIFHFLHYSNSFISFLSYLVINQLSYSDNQYKLLQKLLFQLVFCKFFIILSMPLAGDIGKVCYSVMLLLEIKSSLQDIDKSSIDQSKQTQDNQTNNHSIDINFTKTQFLLILAAITFSVLCFSMYKVYKAWKYLELYNMFSSRDGVHHPQRQSINISDNEIRQRAKSTDGLNEVELQTLKKTQFEAIQLEPKQSQPSQTCSICFLEIENKSSIYELECKHIFHSDCLDTWLKNKNSCPNCRSKVIQRSQLVIQSLEDAEISIQSYDNSNNNEQLFQQIIRQNGNLVNQQIDQISPSNIFNSNLDEEQIYNPQPSIGNIVDADEENHHHNARTSDNLQYSSQQYLQSAHY